ncbi:unnamed protein product [Notodromas monacha]|uniref:Uncharacterized protein n=1 Tax=Notodromas monacha TaxID=399045 RepID=A0A7R9GJ32_9CRUS|nr:unnamed protein product [Notodromas monacha]CAG0923212.1 unnamed protein product [Notodromas monacha]
MEQVSEEEMKEFLRTNINAKTEVGKILADVSRDKNLRKSSEDEPEDEKSKKRQKLDQKPDVDDEKEAQRKLYFARAKLVRNPALGNKKMFIPVEWPKLTTLSRFHVEEQRNIVECLRMFPTGRRPVKFKSQCKS